MTGHDAKPLPVELQILADYLSAEPAASAIIALPRENDRAEIVYVNPASENSPDTANRLAQLLRLISQAWADATGQSLCAGPIRLDPEWRTRISGDYCIATAIGQGEKVGHGGNSVDDVTAEGAVDLLRPGPAEESAPDGLITHNDAIPSPAALVDWTRHEIADASPWIKFLRGYDWASTALGPLESWPSLLRTYILQIMINPSPRIVIWGADKTFIYNEACARIVGEKHPSSMGKPTSHHWSEVWEWLEPIFDECYRGAVDRRPAQQLFIDRKGFLEETFWDYTLLPIFDEDVNTLSALLSELPGVAPGSCVATLSSFVIV